MKNSEEPTITYEELELVEKLRREACLKCLKCCKISLLPVDIRDKTELDFYATKGFEFFVSGNNIETARVFTIIHKDCNI